MPCFPGANSELPVLTLPALTTQRPSGRLELPTVGEQFGESRGVFREPGLKGIFNHSRVQ